MLVNELLPVRRVFAGDGPLRDQLKASAEQWGIADKVEFTGAFESLVPILNVTHIVAHPTLNNGRSVRVLEAMACGHPVVASRVGGIPELIEDGISGLLTEPGDPASLAAGIKRLVLDPHARRKMGRAALARFQAGNFSLEAMVATNLKIYHKVLHDWSNP